MSRSGPCRIASTAARSASSYRPRSLRQRAMKPCAVASPGSSTRAEPNSCTAWSSRPCCIRSLPRSTCTLISPDQSSEVEPGLDVVVQPALVGIQDVVPRGREPFPRRWAGPLGGRHEVLRLDGHGRAALHRFLELLLDREVDDRLQVGAREAIGLL